MTADVSSNSLVVHGTVTFNPVNPVSVGITVQILPFLKVNPPSVDEVAAQIFNLISALGRRGPSSPQLSMGRNYQLILRVPIIVTVPIGGFSGLSVGAVVEATPTSSFHFAGPVLVSVPIWIPTGFELDIGNLQAMVDLNALDNFSLGASVALTPGEELYDVFFLRWKSRSQYAGKHGIVGRATERPPSAGELRDRQVVNPRRRFARGHHIHRGKSAPDPPVTRYR